MQHRFPLEFDADFYRSIHADLWNHDAAALVHHYETFGRAEGRRATPAVPREQFVALFPSRVPTLEIGPFNNPLATGNNVRYFDVLDRDGLIERAKRFGFGHETVPQIDYVHPIGDLSIISEKFDVVISSHLVEHQPDLVRHLAQIGSLLTDEGLYFCFIPDKRYCFDHFIAESSIADVCEALIAAIYLDGGYGIAAQFVERNWTERMRKPRRPLRDPKTVLQEWAQGKGLSTPVYREVERTGPHHDPQFRVAVDLPGLDPAEGVGGSKRAAEKVAASAMIAREGVGGGSND